MLTFNTEILIEQVSYQHGCTWKIKYSIHYLFDKIRIRILLLILIKPSVLANVSLKNTSFKIFINKYLENVS